MAQKKKIYGFYGTQHNLNQFRRVFAKIMGWEIEEQDNVGEVADGEADPKKNKYCVKIELTERQALIAKKVIDESPFGECIMFFPLHRRWF